MLEGGSTSRKSVPKTWKTKKELKVMLFVFLGSVILGLFSWSLYSTRLSASVSLCVLNHFKGHSYL